VVMEGLKLPWGGGDSECVSREEDRGTQVCGVAPVVVAVADAVHHSGVSFLPRRNRNAWKPTGTS
jgi:hypothetical protein